MSDNNTILPERSFLKVSIPVTDYCLADCVGSMYRVVFRVNIFNDSRLSVRLMARKWTIVDNWDNMHIIEADHVFGTYPVLAPGGVFSYGGMRDFSSLPKRMELRIVGADQLLVPFISKPCYVTVREHK